MTHPFSLPAWLSQIFCLNSRFLGTVALIGLSASQSVLLAQSAGGASQEAAPLIEGDVLSISFPAAPDLNTSQKIRRDGRITLPLVGEVVVSGITPIQLEKKLLELYDEQLVTKEVSVSVTASTYTFYVNGAVLGPGKKLSDRPLTALEAIMEAGGPSPSANMKKIQVTRKVGEKYVHHQLNLKDVLDGKKESVFYIKPSDIITVPEKFVIF